MLLLGRIVASCTEGFHDEKYAEELDQFFKENPTPIVTRAVNQTVEKIRIQALWFNREKDSVGKYFN